ncbi:MAG: hypothetical protein PHQ43_01280 [Dehalococcoidales bacterium]|nr:hypothetical protein [Dehalococcoidales bacterium]
MIQDEKIDTPTTLPLTVPDSVVQCYFRPSGHSYLHIPARLARQCQIISGSPSAYFSVFVKDNKLILEQTNILEGIKP